MYYVMQISSSPLISRHGYRCGNSTFNLLICWLSLWAHFVCTSTIGILPPEFMLLSNGTVTTAGRGCIPEGTSAGYQCTVVGDGVTVWRGSAFSCQAESIPLAHDKFTDPDGLTIACDGLTATTVGVVDDTQYISRVIFNATRSLNGTTVYCTLNTVQSFGSDTIIVGVIPSAPVPLTVTFSVTESSFTVSWSPPGGDVVGGLRGYQFITTSTGGDCGCQNETLSSSNTMTCSGWEARGQTCSFTVRTLSLDCGFISEPSIQSVNLLVPSSPTNVLLRLPDTENNDGVVSIVVEFVPVDEQHLGDNLNSEVTYTIEVNGLPFKNNLSCNTSVNLCMFNITGNFSGNYNVSVFASNIIGSSEPIYYMECDAAVLGAVINLPTSSQPRMINVTGGTVNVSSSAPLSIATLTCDEGYEPESSTNSTCQFNGTWSEMNLRCQVPNGTNASCSLACVASIAAVVGLIMVVLIIICIIVLLYTLRICHRSGTMKGNKEQCVASSNLTTTVFISNEESTYKKSDKPNPHTDTYADPLDMVEPSQESKIVGTPANKSSNVAKQTESTDDVDTSHSEAQYETVSLKPAPSVEPPRQDLYSEPFGALPAAGRKSVKVTTQKETAAS